MTERDLLAAEHALGLLEGEALLEARGLVASDAEFAAEVARWESRFAPLYDEIAAVPPPETLWPRVQQSIDQPGDSGDVIALRRTIGRWKAFAAGASAIAASLALVVVTGPQPATPPAATAPASAPVMVAALMSPDKQMMLSASYEPDGSLMIMPGDMPPAAGHSHELWIIPADGKPRSLGIVSGAHPSRMAIPSAMAPHFARASVLAVSVEPEGGSPGDGPTGPVVASGPLSTV